MEDNDETANVLAFRWFLCFGFGSCRCRAHCSVWIERIDERKSRRKRQQQQWGWRWRERRLRRDQWRVGWRELRHEFRELGNLHRLLERGRSGGRRGGRRVLGR